MARGWESKSVESQREDAAPVRERREAPSREERERQARRNSLELSRQRVLRELATAQSSAHKAALENGLSYLEAELKKFQ